MSSLCINGLFWNQCIIALEGISEVALSTVLPVKVGYHKNTGSTFRCWTFTSQTIDFAVVVNLVVLQRSELDVLMLVLDDLWGKNLASFKNSIQLTKYQWEIFGAVDVICARFLHQNRTCSYCFFKVEFQEYGTVLHHLGVINSQNF